MLSSTPTGNHAHTLPAQLAIAHQMGRFAPIDSTLTDADLNDCDRSELRMIELHQQAYNALGRARTHLLRHGAGNTQQAIAQAEHAISAMAALYLMNGRA